MTTSIDDNTAAPSPYVAGLAEMANLIRNSIRAGLNDPGSIHYRRNDLLTAAELDIEVAFLRSKEGRPRRPARSTSPSKPMPPTC